MSDQNKKYFFQFLLMTCNGALEGGLSRVSVLVLSKFARTGKGFVTFFTGVDHGPAPTLTAGQVTSLTKLLLDKTLMTLK